MADDTRTLEIPAVHISEFRRSVREGLSLAGEDTIPAHDSPELREGVLDCQRLIDKYVSVLDQIGWDDSDPQEDKTVTAAQGVLLGYVDELIDRIAEDAAVAGGEYPAHPRDPEALGAVGVRASWLAEARKLVA